MSNITEKEIGMFVRRYPHAMPAGVAMRVLGLSSNTFYRRVREKCVRYVQDGPGSRKLYLTEPILQMRGIDLDSAKQMRE